MRSLQLLQFARPGWKLPSPLTGSSDSLEWHSTAACQIHAAAPGQAHLLAALVPPQVVAAQIHL